MFSRPVRSGAIPARTSISAPTRPPTSTRPAVGYITRVRIFRNVDLPAPFEPTSPQDSPGCAVKSIWRSAHRHPGLFCPRIRSRSRPIWSWRYVGLLSTRKRFHTSVVAIVPSRNVGDPRFQTLEEDVAADEDDRGRDAADDLQRPVRLVAEQHRVAKPLDHRHERVDRGVDDL